MMLPALILSILGLPILALAAATITLERTPDLPHGWGLLRDAQDDDSLALFVALRQPRMDDLRSKLVQVDRSDTRDDRGGHLSQKQVSEYRKADRTSVDLVMAWLESHGIEHAKAFDSWVSFNITAKAAGPLLGAELGWYSYGGGGEPVLRAREYTIPAWLKGHVDFVHPVAHFMPPRSAHVQLSKAVVEATADTAVPNGSGNAQEVPCATGVFPECIKKLYNITYDAAGPSPVRFGVAGFLEQYINYADVSAFLDMYVPELANLDPPYNFTVELLNDGANPQAPIWMAGLEASLDVQYAMAIGYPTAVTYYSTGGRGVKLDGSGAEIPMTGSDNEPYLELLEGLVAKPDDEIPHVLSISYADDEQSVPQAYALRVCDLLAQLAARGVSVLAASGDGGAAGTGQSYCYANDGEQRRMLIPTFPASCPWVTSVGATNNDGANPTAAAFSAGGFSRYFSRQAWQDDAVGAYLKMLARTNNSNLGMFNESGRAIPDISAVGTAFQIQFGGGGSAVLGTSASTPVMAGMIALINDARLRAGKSSLGWLNPLLYADSVRDVLTDITRGRGQGCSFGDDEEDGKGWPVVEGYDCVTGLGIPGDFGRLFEVLA
ncbi:tripeptidyl-peptidase-like protein [Phialemonium atrogriseum]|uniref:tripeptidyl-peptidase II n=1 Tax=Phialemonium atrogriseum TaxID=1093897 RepID=A0AAJ0BXS3_9PEZI|nr:tripeptidyl-peptidase-like protein [Phialemonium atrogriseum]KAK1765827.1 tripeptidyl-peptidase-like protein [Phialemonium atrogriseum]